MHPTPGMSPQTSCFPTAKRSTLETGSARRTLGELARWCTLGQSSSPCSWREGPARRSSLPGKNLARVPLSSLTCRQLPRLLRSEHTLVSEIGPSLHSTAATLLSLCMDRCTSSDTPRPNGPWLRSRPYLLLP